MLLLFVENPTLAQRGFDNCFFLHIRLHNTLKNIIFRTGIQVTPLFWVNFNVSKLNVPFVHLRLE